MTFSTHFSSFTLALVAGTILCTINAFSQSTERIAVPADGCIRTSLITVPSQRYRITVEGTYSMWPQFTDCHGVDGAYVYDVPQEELNTLRWPPSQLVSMPHWVGDPAEWSFGPVMLSFRRSKGFRIDGEPLPDPGYAAATHRYQIEKIGTGRPFTFQILDSNYSILQAKYVPRYEDNCGSLTVTVEAVTSAPDVNICNIQALCSSGRVTGMRLWAGIFVEDATQPGGKRNLLGSIDPSRIALIDDGIVVCGVDSIVCEEDGEPIAVGLLVDRSGSMGFPISSSDATIRMTASQNAITHFIDQLRPSDSAFVMSFSASVRTDAEWTADKQVLTRAVQALSPETSTSLHDAVLEALRKTAAHAGGRRSLIVLSDGVNTSGHEWSSAYLDEVQKYNIPVHIIALGLTDAEEERLGRERMQIITRATGGSFSPVSNAARLDSVYQELRHSLTTAECCAIYFRGGGCVPGTIKHLRLLYSPSDTLLLTKVISYTCPDCATITTVHGCEEAELPAPLRLEIAPVPARDGFTLRYVLAEGGDAWIRVYDTSGSLVREARRSGLAPGKHSEGIDLRGLPSGVYYAVVLNDGRLIRGKGIILR